MISPIARYVRWLYGPAVLMPAALGVFLAVCLSGWSQADQTKPAPAPSGAAPGSVDEKIPEVQVAIERFRRGDLAGALEKLQEARKARAELPPAKLMLARMVLAANQLPTARALLEDVAAEEPDYPVTYTLFGNLALAENRVSDAQLNYLKARESLAAVKNLPDDQKTEVQAQSLSGLAAVAERRQNWQAALPSLEELLKVKPSDGSAYQRLARALFYLDRREEALTQLKKAVQADPKLDPPGITMGWLLADRNAFDEALASMKQAVADEPDSPAAHLGLGTFLLQREQPEAALPEAQKAIEQAPDSSPAKRLLGAIVYRLDRYDEAEKLLSSVVESTPEDLATSNLLAMVLADKSDEESRKKAVEIAEANIQRGGQTPQTLSTLGWAYYRAGRLDEALEVLQAATASGQASADTAYYLASVMADKGQEADAMKLLRSALDAPVGQFAARDEARKRLEALARKATAPSGGTTSNAKAATPKAGTTTGSSTGAPKAATPKAGTAPSRRP